MSRLRAVLRMPGAIGVVLAVVSIPLILLLPGAGIFVALVVLSLYPLLDVPRTLARPSWWRGALVSALVWFVVFVALAEIADAVGRVGDDAMVLLFPFLLYPMALVLSGLVRLESRLRGRPPESGPRRAAIVVAAGSALFVLIPVTLAVIPALMEKVTGNTPGHTVYSGDGQVLSATSDHVSVRRSGKDPESFRIGSWTKFDFRGPGSPTVTEPAGPAWLKEGQRVGLEYVYRGGEAQAQSVNIWIERKGCAGDATWSVTGDASAPAAVSMPSLMGTQWRGWVGSQDASSRPQITTLEFLEQNQLAYQDIGGARNTNAHWRQNGLAVRIEINDCYAVYEGRVAGDEIVGQFRNEMGGRAAWTARRVQSAGSTPMPR